MELQVTNKEGKVFMQIKHFPNDNILYINWIGEYISMGDAKRGSVLALEKIKELQIHKILNDNTQLSIAWDTLNDWVKDFWIPNALALGVKKFAHIASEDLFTLLSAEFMEENAKLLGLPMKIFQQRPDALAWLREG